MSTGALIYAQNNSSVDYVKLAAFAAKKVKEHLEIPVSLVTDSPDWAKQSQPDDIFENIISFSPQSTEYYNKRFNDGALSSKILEWKNLERGTAFDVSPYDTTLVLDADYIVNSNFLKPFLENTEGLQIYKNCFDLSGWRGTTSYEKISPYSIPFYWATVFIFTKNKVIESFFNLIKHIRDNWAYYRTLYNIEYVTFRNDFAFSMAIHIMNGKTNGDFPYLLPGRMSYITDRDYLVSIDNNSIKFLVEKQNYLGEYTLAKVKGLDVHIMNKYSLARYIDGGLGV